MKERARAHGFIFCFVLLMVFSFAALLRFYIPPVPFTGPDSIGYLGVPFHFLETNLFQGNSGRGIVYPAFLTAILLLFKSVKYVPLIQHLTGLAAGVLFLVSWNGLYRVFLPGEEHPWGWRVYASLGIITATLFLLAPGSVMIEHWTHPESITSFLLILFFYGYVKLIEALREERKAGAFFYFNFCFVLNFLLFVFQPRWGFGLITVFLALGVLWFLIRENRGKKGLVLLAIPVSICVVGIYLPDRIFTSQDLAYKTNGLKTIFSSNQNAISLRMESSRR